MNDARVLIVEDEPSLRDLMRHLLEQEGYTVLWAEDGEEGFRRAKSERPDLIMLDVMLPKMNGFEVTQKLRQDPETCLIPIVLATSLSSTRDKLTGFKLGADEYIAKPFQPMEMLLRVERLLARSRREMEENPLTGMGGAGPLREHLRRRLLSKDPFFFVLAKAWGLREFNTLFSFERGDGVIRLVATVLRSALLELGNREDVAAHLGGGSFAMITRPPRGTVIGLRVLENVEQLVPLHYDEPSRERGHALSTATPPQAVPFVQLSLGCVLGSGEAFHHPAQVLDRAEEALKEARAKGTNQMVVV